MQRIFPFGQRKANLEILDSLAAALVAALVFAKLVQPQKQSMVIGPVPAAKSNGRAGCLQILSGIKDSILRLHAVAQLKKRLIQLADAFVIKVELHHPGGASQRLGELAKLGPV